MPTTPHTNDPGPVTEDPEPAGPGLFDREAFEAYHQGWRDRWRHPRRLRPDGGLHTTVADVAGLLVTNFLLLLFVYLAMGWISDHRDHWALSDRQRMWLLMTPMHLAIVVALAICWRLFWLRRGWLLLLQTLILAAMVAWVVFIWELFLWAAGLQP
jgi:hypothetical protein